MERQGFFRLLILGILGIVFWVAVWDSIELLIDKFLNQYGQKDNDNIRLVILGVLGVISVGLIYSMNAMDLIG